MKRILNLVCLLLMAGASHAIAQESYQLGIDDSRVLSFSRLVDRALVRNPEIVSVKVLSSRELLITGQRAGSTVLEIWHRDGVKQALSIAVEGEIVSEARRRESLRTLVRRLDPEGRVAVEVQERRAILTGAVSNADRRQRLEAMVTAMGYQPVNLITLEGSQQVQLSVRVAELVKGNPLRSGASFADKRDRLMVLPPGSGSSANFLLELQQAAGSATLPVPHSDAFQIHINPAKASLFGLLNLMEGHNLARVLAQPTLVVESGKTAKFLAGGEVPIPIAQDENTISVDYKEFGVMVEFTPRILDDGIISIDVTPEVSNIDEAAGITLGSIRIPGFRTRRTQTTVSVKDGESFMVGGLLQDEIRSVVQKVPLFGDIPILGALFRSSAYDKDQSELAIIVTPRIVTPTPAGETIPLPGEGLDRPSTAEAILLGKVVSDGGKRSVLEPGLEVPR